MIKVYKANGEFYITTNDYEDLEITREINKLDKIRFRCEREVGIRIELEGYIECEYGRFVIKERGKSGRYEMFGEMDLSTLDGFVFPKKYDKYIASGAIAEIINGTGWMVQGSISGTHTFDMPPMSRVSAIFNVINECGGEIRFDERKKLIYIGDKLGQNRGAYFHSELNLRDVNLSSDSYGFATRLYPFGAEGLTIAAANNGIPYLDINDYQDPDYPWERRIDKLVSAEWVDERYTSAETLKEAAIKKLQDASKTMRNVQCDVTDLSASNDYYNYEHLEFDIGDTVTLIDEQLKMKEVQRVIQMSLFPDDISRNKVTFDNKPRSVEDRFKEIASNSVKKSEQVADKCILLKDSDFVDIPGKPNEFTVKLPVNGDCCLIVPSIIKGSNSELCSVTFNSLGSVSNFKLSAEKPNQKLLGIDISFQEETLNTVDLTNINYDYISLKTYHIKELRPASLSTSVLGSYSQYRNPIEGDYSFMFHTFAQRNPLSIILNNQFKNLLNMKDMFSDSSFRYLEVKGSTTQLNSMERTFENSIISYLNLSAIDTSNCANFRHTFYKSIIDVLDIRKFNLTSVTDINSIYMRTMFGNAIIKKIIIPKLYESEFRTLLQQAIAPETIFIQTA